MPLGLGASNTYLIKKEKADHKASLAGKLYHWYSFKISKIFLHVFRHLFLSTSYSWLVCIEYGVIQCHELFIKTQSACILIILEKAMLFYKKEISSMQCDPALVGLQTS